MTTNETTDYADNCAAHARAHADEAERLVKETVHKHGKKRAALLPLDLQTLMATQANAPRHARALLAERGPPMSTQPLLGITAIARRLGISDGNAATYSPHATTSPPPTTPSTTGRVWAADAVETWIATHPRYDHSGGAGRCPTCGQVVAA